MSNKQDYIKPEVNNDSMTCPHCGCKVAQMDNFSKDDLIYEKFNIILHYREEERYRKVPLKFKNFLLNNYSTIDLRYCVVCKKDLIYLNKELIYPQIPSGSEIENLEIPDEKKEQFKEVEKLYNEAKNVFDISPRLSAVALRTALEKLLCILLNESEIKNLNDAIKKLEEHDDYNFYFQNPAIKKAVQIIRKFGNNGAHYKEFNINDDKNSAIKLFFVMKNLIEKLIVEPLKINKDLEDLDEKLNTKK